MPLSNVVKTFILASIAVTAIGGAMVGTGAESLLIAGAPKSDVTQRIEKPKSYIVQGKRAETLKTAVTSVGGSVSREFPIINAVSAVLTPSQAEVISKLDDVRIQDDRSVATMSNGNGNKKFVIDNYIATQTDADKLHDLGITGLGVTVAVLDSGATMAGQHGFNLLIDSEGYWRVPAKYDAIKSKKTWWLNDDKNGHGSHVSGIIASSLKSENGKFNGIAPDVYLLSVKAFDRNGQSSYSKVLDGLNWIYHNRERYRIRVLNLSLGADVQSNYWDDPINQAIMKLWQAGVVVVTSAGNSGHLEQGITVPGNNPYIITVGATTDNYTPFDFSDDRVTTFSSTGPTIEGFVKPEVVAYGGHVAAKIDKRFSVGSFHESETGIEYQEISGTSQASAVVSGIAALMLQYNPYLSPDDVKCRIIASAKVARNENGKMSFSPFEQGHGMVNAYNAVASQETGCANRGLDIAADLAGTTHFMGPVTKDEQGEFAIVIGNAILTEGHQWDDAGMHAEGHQWDDAGIFAQGHQWDDTGVFTQGHQWDDTGVFTQGHQWDDAAVFSQGHQWDNPLSAITGFQWGNIGVFAQGHQWDDAGISMQGHQWDGASVLAEAWNQRAAFAELTEALQTTQDAVIIAEDGEEAIDEWQITERVAPTTSPVN